MSDPPRARTQILPPKEVFDKQAIHTEKWTLNGLGNFVSPDNPDIHTQNKKIMWMRVKQKLQRQSGTSMVLFQKYLSELRRRDFHRNDDKFSALMCCIADLYVS